jgi:small subunit ribosomal protein S18
MSGLKQKRLESRSQQKLCKLCEGKVDRIDYKDPLLLRRYLTEQSKIVPRRQSGSCAEHQRMITLAIKRSRQIALIEGN